MMTVFPTLNGRRRALTLLGLPAQLRPIVCANWNFEKREKIFL